MEISFALGKAYEDIQNFEKSFSFYKEANLLCRKKIIFSINEEKEKFKEIKNIYEEKLFNKFHNSGFLDSSPIFILGMPRSGTTLIEQILSNHSEVFGADALICGDQGSGSIPWNRLVGPKPTRERLRPRLSLGLVRITTGNAFYPATGMR